jgi:hypothetical protein
LKLGIAGRQGAAGPLESKNATLSPSSKGGMASLDTIVRSNTKDIAEAIGIELERAAEIHAAAKRAHENTVFARKMEGLV